MDAESGKWPGSVTVAVTVTVTISTIQTRVSEGDKGWGARSVVMRGTGNLLARLARVSSGLAGLSLYDSGSTILLVFHCIAGLPLYCWGYTVLLGSRCIVGGPLYCQTKIKSTYMWSQIFS